MTALNDGVAGYVLKESCGELLQAVREVIAGRRYISLGISEASIGSFSSIGTMLQRTQAGSAKIQDKLTVREQEILRLFAICGGEEQFRYCFPTQDQFPQGRIQSSQLYEKVGAEHPRRPDFLCSAAWEPREGRAKV